MGFPSRRGRNYVATIPAFKVVSAGTSSKPRKRPKPGFGGNPGTGGKGKP